MSDTPGPGGQVVGFIMQLGLLLGESTKSASRLREAPPARCPNASAPLVHQLNYKYDQFLNLARQEKTLYQRDSFGAILYDASCQAMTEMVDETWAFEQGIALHFIRPGKPTENGHIESFNGKLRDECLNQNWFTDLADARQAI